VSTKRLRIKITAVKRDIKRKLQSILNKTTLEEPEVVYILSCIRKILEVDDGKKDFKILNFYCNWALHPEIEDINATIIERFKEPGHGAVAIVHLFPDLDEEMRRFMQMYNFSTSIFQNDETIIQFHRILGQIYSDTPLILRKVTKKKITFRVEENSGRNSAMLSTIVEETT